MIMILRSQLGVGLVTVMLVHSRRPLRSFFAFITLFNSSFLLCPASGYSTFCRASRWQPVVHGGLSAAGQLITLVYRGKINDPTVWSDESDISSFSWKLWTIFQIYS